MLDLREAFELVQRCELLEAGLAAGCPLDVLAWGLEMHSWLRRLVFRGRAAPELLPALDKRCFDKHGLCSRPQG